MSDSTINIIICDDMEICRKSVMKLCKKYFNVKKANYKLTEFASGEEVLNYENDIDILVLDIEMDKVNGIDVKNRLLEKRKETAIIFMTNHSEYIKEAFGKNVFGFIEKKEDNKEFFKILDKVYLELFNYCLIDVEEKGLKIQIRSDSIVRIEVNNQYVDIYTISKKRYTNRISLNNMEKLLVDYGFYRINRKHMVNLKYVDTVLGCLKLDNGYQYILSKRILSKFKKAYIEYIEKNNLK